MDEIKKFLIGLRPNNTVQKSAVFIAIVVAAVSILLHNPFSGYTTISKFNNYEHYSDNFPISSKPLLDFYFNDFYNLLIFITFDMFLVAIFLFLFKNEEK
jgi:hypothetical protein